MSERYGVDDCRIEAPAPKSRNVMSDLSKRLRASLRCDAINGNSFERSVCARQMREAADVLDQQAADIANYEARVDYLELQLQVTK